MANYAFKIYLVDGKERIIIPNEIQKEKVDLSDVDIYINSKGGYFGILLNLAKENQISTSMIQKVSILHLSRETEFSIISNNFYLISVFNDLQKKKVSGYYNDPREVTTIPFEHPSYQEMKEYLLEQLRNHYQTFLKQVYPYHNQFSKLLYQYGSIYQQGGINSEDFYHARQLENKIALELSIYKNFRSLSLARQLEDINFRKNNQRQSPKNTISRLNVRFTNIPVKEVNFYFITQEEANRINCYTNDLGDEKEEFLEPEEIERCR